MHSVDQMLADFADHFRTTREHQARHSTRLDDLMTFAERLLTAFNHLADKVSEGNAALTANITALTTMKADNDALKAAAASAKSDHEALASQVADLTTKNADLEKKVAEELDPAAAEAIVSKIESITGPVADTTLASSGSASSTMAPTAPVVTTAGSATVIVVPAASSTSGIDPATGTSVAPGTTAHSDTSTGVTTTVPHDGNAPTAVAASGAAVQPEPAVVQAAVAASAAAGVKVAA